MCHFNCVCEVLNALFFVSLVLLYTTAIPADVWHRISIFAGVLIMRGSALEESTLRRAGIFRAKKVVCIELDNCIYDQA